MPHRLKNQHPIAFVTGAGGLAVSAGSTAAGVLAQAAGATDIPQGGLTAASLMGAALAGLAFYSQVRAAKRREDAADAAGKLEYSTKEYEVWGPKFEAELDRRVAAESRLKIVEEHVIDLKAQIEHLTANVKQAGKVNAEISRHNAATLDSLKHDVRKARAEVRQIASPSSSGIGLDETATPVPDPPKPKPK